jgi:hypothetical protein
VVTFPYKSAKHTNYLRQYPSVPAVLILSNELPKFLLSHLFRLKILSRDGGTHYSHNFDHHYPEGRVEKVIIIFQIWKMIEVLLTLILPFLPLLESYRVERSNTFCQESFLEMSMSTKNRAIVNDFFETATFYLFSKDDLHEKAEAKSPTGDCQLQRLNIRRQTGTKSSSSNRTECLAVIS